MKGREWFGGDILAVNRHYIRQFEVLILSADTIHVSIVFITLPTM